MPTHSAAIAFQSQVRCSGELGSRSALIRSTSPETGVGGGAGAAHGRRSAGCCRIAPRIAPQRPGAVQTGIMRRRGLAREQCRQSPPPRGCGNLLKSGCRRDVLAPISPATPALAAARRRDRHGWSFPSGARSSTHGSRRSPRRRWHDFLDHAEHPARRAPAGMEQAAARTLAPGCDPDHAGNW